MKTLEECVEAAVAVLDLPARMDIAANPIRGLTNLGLKVRSADHLNERRDDGGSCDGISFLQDGVILYAATESRREYFTLAHELGHWLVYQVGDIYDWLDEQPEPGVALETLCDRIASRLLVPDTVISQIIGSGPVQASHVADLFRETTASVPVCAIALAGRLPRLGAVIVIDQATATVQYASIRPDPDLGWPMVHPWPGQPVPAAHPLRSLRPGGDIRRRSFWETPWKSRADFYLDAFAGERRTVAVLTDEDIWGVEAFHPQTSRNFDQRPQLEVRCCGRSRLVRAYPCPDCGQAHCPQCMNCRCDRRAAAESRCAGRCGLQYLPHLLADGLCEDCR